MTSPSNLRRNPPAARRRARIGWAAMTFFSLAIVFVASRYLTLDPRTYFDVQRAVYQAHTAALITHIVGAMVALLLGPFQFLGALRRRAPAVHRAIGRLYLAGVGVGGIGGLLMAGLAYGGPVARLGFAALALLWLFTTATAWRHILRRDVARHRAWMVRSFALTFAAVTLRTWLPAMTAAGLELSIAYPIVAWLCWVPNLASVEIGLRRARIRAGGSAQLPQHHAVVEGPS